MNIVSKLVSAGLDKKAAKIYEYVLRQGGAFPSTISKATEINRTTTYSILLNLDVKGLVNQIKKNGKSYYQTTGPTKFRAFIKSQLTIAKRKHDKGVDVLTDIEGLFQSLPNKPKITYYEGIEGVLEVYQDHVNVESSYKMLGFANAGALREFFPTDFFTNYRKSKQRKGITTRGIIPDTKLDMTFNEDVYKGIQKPYWPVMRHIPAEKFPYNGELTIYGQNKVSIVNFNKNNYVGVIIEDNSIHGMLKVMFELAWDGAKDFPETRP